jgi:hypothetical protein
MENGALLTIKQGKANLVTETHREKMMYAR